MEATQNAVETSIRTARGEVYWGGLLMYRNAGKDQDAKIFSRYLREKEIIGWPGSICMPTFEDWKRNTLD